MAVDHSLTVRGIMKKSLVLAPAIALALTGLGAPAIAAASIPASAAAAAAEPVFPKITTSDITYTEGDDDATISITGTATPNTPVDIRQLAIMTTSGNTYYVKSAVPEVTTDDTGAWTLELPLSTTFGAQYRNDIHRQLSNTDDSLDEVVTGDTLSIMVSAAGKSSNTFITLTVDDAPEEPAEPGHGVRVDAPAEVTRKDLKKGFVISGTNSTGEHIMVSVHPSNDDRKPTTFRFPGSKTEWAKTFKNIKHTAGVEPGDTLTVEVRYAKGDRSVITTETIVVTE